jgi:hypothetical protein
VSAVLDEPLTATEALAAVRAAYAEQDGWADTGVPARCAVGVCAVDDGHCAACDWRDARAARAELALLDAGGSYDDLVALWPEELQGWAEGWRPGSGWRRSTAGDGSTTGDILEALAGGPLRFREIARALGVAQTRLGRPLADLVAQGRVVRPSRGVYALAGVAP